MASQPQQQRLEAEHLPLHPEVDPGELDTSHPGRSTVPVAVPCPHEFGSSPTVPATLPNAAVFPCAVQDMEPSAPPPPQEDATQGSDLEILPGLRVRLGGQHSVKMNPVGSEDDSDGGRSVHHQLLVRAETFSLGPPDLFLTGTGLGLRVTVTRSANAFGSDSAESWPDQGAAWGNFKVMDATLSMTAASLGPLVDVEDAEEFLTRFGPCGNPRSTHSSAGGDRGKKEGDDFLSLDDTDVSLPGARVGSFECRLPGIGTAVTFPECVGAEQCTLRALLGYYVRTILDKMGEAEDTRRQPGGEKGEDAVSLKAASADITSVYGSAVGMAAGSLLFGPVGLVAGSYYGGKAGRAHSSALIGAAAGAVLLGPVGLVAGAIAGSRRDVVESERKASAEAAAPKKVGDPEEHAADEHGDVLDGAARAAGRYVSSNKNELAGSTGVCAGAAAGAAVLGPIGIIPGALAGSLSGRKMVQDCSGESEWSAPGEASRQDQTLSRASRVEQGVESGGGGEGTVTNKPYRFGDITRGIVARGKESRGAAKNEGYKFGDFTRGLFK